MKGYLRIYIDSTATNLEFRISKLESRNNWENAARRELLASRFEIRNSNYPPISSYLLRRIVSFQHQHSSPMPSFTITPIGQVHSPLRELSEAPRQGWEGAPNAHLEILPAFVKALDGVKAGEEIWVFTWLHQAERSVLKVHPRNDVRNPVQGVFATRSPDRPNPIGLHRALVLKIERDRWIEVQNLEAIDGTPIIDIKPVIERAKEH
jgi:tRNA-Thr(GGU) m(6)t(6)A37 methyltransferase TsaA